MAARMRKRPDGRYVVTVTYEDSEGAKRRHFVYGKTQAEANAKAKACDRTYASTLARVIRLRLPILTRVRSPCFTIR